MKARLSEFLKLVRGGREVIVTDREKPVAKMIAFSPSPARELEVLRGRGNRELMRKLGRLPRSSAGTSAVALLLEERRNR